jgi:hypothetical protein
MLGINCILFSFAKCLTGAGKKVHSDPLKNKKFISVCPLPKLKDDCVVLSRLDRSQQIHVL